LDERAWLARYAAIGLVVFAGLEWFLFRLVSRFASAPMLEGPPRTIIESLGRTGLFLVAPAFLLAVCLLGLAVLGLGASAARSKRMPLFVVAVYLGVLVTLLAAHSFSEKQGWLDITLNVLSLVGVWTLCGLFLAREGVSASARAAVALVGIAYSASMLYVVQQLTTRSGTSVESTGIFARDIGELAAVAAPVAFFVAVALPHGRWRDKRRWIAPVTVSLLFAAGNVADAVFNQGFTGVLTTWSLGFNLVWPWPIYVLALALFIFAVLTCFAPDREKAPYANMNTGIGLLLLFFAGYELKVQYQHMLMLLSLMILTELFLPLATTIRDRPRAKGIESVLGRPT
jgi:hypothetical protein